MSKFGNWTYYVPISISINDSIPYNNMSNEDSFLFNSTRHIVSVDLDGMNYVRLLVNKQSISGNIGSKITLKYSTVFSQDSSDYIDVGITPVEVNIDVENTFLKTNWIELKTKEDVFFAIIGNGGNGNISPTFGSISLEFS